MPVAGTVRNRLRRRSDLCSSGLGQVCWVPELANSSVGLTLKMSLLKVLISIFLLLLPRKTAFINEIVQHGSEE